MISTREIEQLLDRGSVLDGEDNTIGKVEQIFLDDQTSEPEWVTVKTGLFGGAASFVPLRDARVQGKDLVVPFTKNKVKDAPRVEDADKHLTRDEEAELYRYYGREYTDYTGKTEPGSGSKDAGRATSGDNDATMPRSQEQLHAGTEQVSAAKVRLRKHVVTQNVATTVPVSHEEVRLEPEPITAEDQKKASAGGSKELGSDEQEIELTKEPVVGTKETVPVEKVSLGTETVTAEQQVPEEVRKQQIDTDADADADDGREYQPRHRGQRRRWWSGPAEGS